MAHCDRNGTMVRTDISPKLDAIFRQGFQFPDKEVSTESITHAANRRKARLQTSGLSPRPTTQLELSKYCSLVWHFNLCTKASIPRE
eukprot:scaffold18361_cov96-Skeletonema_dohrnii-CCMP3373.AAC.1